MGYSSTSVNANGEVMCTTCRKKFNLSQVSSCAYCDKFVCNSCAARKNGHVACERCKNS